MKNHIKTRIKMGDSAYIAKLLHENQKLEDKVKQLEGKMLLLEAIKAGKAFVENIRKIDSTPIGDPVPKLDPIWPIKPENKAFFDLAFGKITESSCPCEKCELKHRPKWSLGPHFFTICPICGNKRCPKGTDHDLECTGSNESGQKGSSWENVIPGGLPTKLPTDQNGCHTIPNGDCISPGPCIHTVAPKSTLLDAIEKESVPLSFPPRPIFPPNRRYSEGTIRMSDSPVVDGRTLHAGKKRGFWAWLFGEKN